MESLAMPDQALDFLAWNRFPSRRNLLLELFLSMDTVNEKISVFVRLFKSVSTKHMEGVKALLVLKDT